MYVQHDGHLHRKRYDGFGHDNASSIESFLNMALFVLTGLHDIHVLRIAVVLGVALLACASQLTWFAGPFSGPRGREGICVVSRW